jgi:hypothetical protein
LTNIAPDIIQNYDVRCFDYAIFDKQIALEWDISSTTPSNASELNLIDLHSEGNADKLTIVRERIQEIWNHTNGELFLTISKMDDIINSSKWAYLESLTTEKSNFHSYSYHAFGADRWIDMNEDAKKFGKYSLGTKEQNYLTKFFLPSLSKNDIGKDRTTKFDILHIGVGSGVEIEPIIYSINSMHKQIEKYAIVDVSYGLLKSVREQETNLVKRVGVDVFVTEKPFIYFDPVDVTTGEVVNSIGRDFTRLKVNGVPLTTQIGGNIEGLSIVGNVNPLIFILVANGYLLSQKLLLESIARVMREGIDYLLVTTEINNTVSSSEEDNNKNLANLIAPYVAPSALQLLDISLNPLGIINTVADDYDFRFQLCHDPKTIYQKDIFEGFFKLQDWRRRHNHKTFSINDFGNKPQNIADGKVIKIIDELNSKVQIKVFQTYKPSNHDSIVNYLDNLDNINGKLDIVYSDFNSEYNQVGLVIKKIKV